MALEENGRSKKAFMKGCFMNVLLLNPPYPKTYWSLNAVLQMTGKKIHQPPLGLITLAALLPERWNFKLIELTEGPVAEVDWRWCDLVMISGMTVQYRGILDCILEGRRRGKFVVAGGPAVFHAPREVQNAGADIVVKGEAEPLIPRLLDAIERGDSGLLLAAEEWADLSDSPVPRYDLVDPAKYTGLALQFSRGCPYKCDFCDITLMLGRRVRTKRAEQILAELQNLYDLGWRWSVMFVDDNLIGNSLKTKGLLQRMIPWMESHGNPFEFDAQASVNLAEDPEMVELMVRANFAKVFLGIETTDEESLHLSKKYQNTGKDLNAVCRTINEAGLQVMAGCIIGFDNEKPGADERLIHFTRRNQIPIVLATLLQVGPGMDLWERLKSEGRLLSSGLADDFGNQTALTNFVPSRPLKSIVEELINVYDVLYDPGFFLDRTFQHFMRMKMPPPRKRATLPSFWELKAVINIIIKQGFRYPSRWKFWKYVLMALFRFPKRRFDQFLATCVLGEHYFQFRNEVRDKLLENLRRYENNGSAFS